MKVAPREAAAFLDRPSPHLAAILLTGEGGRVADARARVLAALLGPDAEAEMRLERLPGADVRREGGRLHDALRATGFFPGPRAVLLEDATDGLAPAVEAALAGWREGDAVLVAAGGALAAKGALRRLLEGRRDAAVLTFYDDPPSEADLRRLVDAAPLGPLGAAAREALLAAGAALEPAEFRGVLEKLALHHAAGGATSAEAVRDLSPLGEADVDALLLAVTDGERGRVAPLLARLAAQGVGPVAVAVAATRHVRALMAVAEDPGGPEAGVARLRPPAGGARRAALLRGSAWPRARREEALRALVALDLQLRSASRAPGEALLERTLLRLARGAREG